ncbi:carboxymuconolactone decarboxylase family protein [Mucilaginibacter sp. SP1R1]|uniref:carboxymuconolactone decarboxylase family protein n=1 Tax=Mucilaginibacter sp. SP1R1 TaxID=2723091 RepID=UPI00161A1CB2|nr:carboxymuconolactone decarboxylase family protein [Mucilaginibacter sp. SP1R1]MBB6149109.1 AhpD family alkylhydroperoxidase [Mucilaginibacter sp. SP1R1]
MEQRINVFEKGQGAMRALYGLGTYLAKSPVEQSLLHLIYFRVSQINGCAYCLDMHSKDLRAGGESEHRLYVLNAWREAPFYSDRERAGLAWAEALTKISGGQVPDEIYNEARNQFTEQELIDLTLAIITINGYNRVNIAFPAPAIVGTYTPGAHAVSK